MEKKEAMAKKLEDDKAEMARKSADFKIKKRELDEVRIHVAATKEMLRMRRAKAQTHTTRLEMLEEITEVRENYYNIDKKTTFMFLDD